MTLLQMSQWRANWLGRIVAQARLRKWQCPLVWTTSSSFDGVHDDKLQDLVTLAPSEWEAVVRELTRIAMELLLQCPLLSEYREALKHVVDVTCIMVACVLEKKNLDQEPEARASAALRRTGSRDRRQGAEAVRLDATRKASSRKKHFDSRQPTGGTRP
ncbi:hypothetical protein FOCC_FOCC012783 [Frankliniella occidentalis]|nr:hypothetical protein FOCC_FOCC012783 [Frankliniella occidentalis]